MSVPPATDLRVAVSGARGRVGSEVVAALRAEAGFACAAEVDVDDDLGAALRDSSARVLVDFTTPAAGMGNAITAIELGVSVVVGTTGLGPSGVERIRDACRAASIGGCVIPNFALGAALLMWLSELCAPHFETCEIVETHHAGKLDAPSGTALRTAERLLAAREGHAFSRNEPSTTTLAGTRGGSLGGAALHSLRIDGAVADQSVIFGAVGQTLALTHRTTSRAAFIPGVLLAARAVTAEGARFYDSLEEVIGLPSAAAIRGMVRSSAQP
ncbi:MAG TPA: 4-hydroxy-tetrahydrodipicolinate reductase [Candidatus Dormibacteraeota bacterium]|nr:4-hydroxy-tetrahydrodipicolinate reductase [Candidatus Dormibacteraeota bacterium]